MAFETLTLEDKHAFLIALHASLLPDDDLSEGSFLWLWWMTAAAASTDNDAFIAAAKNDLLPDTAPDDGMLDRQGNLKKVVRKGATPSSGSAALRVNGVALTAIPAGKTLKHTNGQRYQIVHDGQVGDGKYGDVDIVSLGAGSATKLLANEHLQFENTPSGLSGDAVLVRDLNGGEDREGEGSFRARVMSRWQDPPMGGTAEDYVQWVLEVTGWDAAFCYPLRRGWGSVDVAALHEGSGTVRAPIAPDVATLQSIMDAKRPISTRPFRILQVTTRAVDVELEITPDGANTHAFDWDDHAAPTVAAWDLATNTVTFSAIPELAPGDRVVFKNASTATNLGAERTVQSLGPGPNDVILEVDQDGDIPVVGATVYAGGALVQPVRAAVRALVDSLGTGNLDGKRFGPWEANIRPGGLYRAAHSVDGVLDTTIDAPAGIEQAANNLYPDDSAVELLVPGRIIVRAAH